MLIIAFVFCIITSIASLSMAQMSTGLFTSVRINAQNIQANEYAQTKAGLLRAKAYNDLTGQNKQAIASTDYSDQVRILEESGDTDSLLRYKKIAVDVFYRKETTPLVTLKLTRSIWSTSGCPIGTIIAWPNSYLPSDGGTWLSCSGNLFDKKVYPELAAILGSNKTPNCRGRYLRGHGLVLGYDSYTKKKFYYNWDDKIAVRKILSYQDDAVQKVEGTFYTFPPEYLAVGRRDSNGYKYFTKDTYAPSGVFYNTTGASWQDTDYDNPSGRNENSTFPYTVHFSTTGQNIYSEAAPVSLAVSFLIKAK